MVTNILDAAHDVLKSGDPSTKADAAFALGRLALDDSTLGPSAVNSITIAPLSTPLSSQPARPDTPVLVPPDTVKRRGLGTLEGRKTLLHAVAHIEFNAIDLAADMIARFTLDTSIAADVRGDFVRDWAKVCQEEAKHFTMIRQHLQKLGIDYGHFSAHGGLWSAAVHTQHDLAARLAIAPMVLEARGLDVTPNMIEKLTSVGDHDSAAILHVIYDEEIGHVKIGTDWFHYVAAQQNRAPKPYFRALVKAFFKGSVKPPFNIPARDLAGLEKDYYMGLESIRPSRPKA